MHVVTGGAGFIGSNIAAALDERGEDLLIVDTLGTGEKWRNIAKRRLVDVVPPEETFEVLGKLGQPVDSVIHMGAISTTTERDGDLILKKNFRYSQRMWTWCAHHKVPLIYASSAATYGDGARGFRDEDDPAYLASLHPLNLYGWSKHVFDRWARDRADRGFEAPPVWAGLKFFNVYGPNEYHKGGQRSVASQIFDKIQAGEPTRLFADDPDNPQENEPVRDFVWVDDCVNAVLWLSGARFESGLYNVGSGTARSFTDLARAVYGGLNKNPNIDYVPVPEQLAGNYQYFTQAAMDKLSEAGCPGLGTDVETGVTTYVRDYLSAADSYR